MTLPALSPSPDDQATLRFVEDIFTEAKKPAKRRVQTWNKYYRLLRNNSWSEFRPNWAPSPASSEVFPTIHTLVSWITDTAPTFYCSSDPELLPGVEGPPHELVAQKTKDMERLLSSWWVFSGCNSELEQALWDTFTFGCGILKTGWDPALQHGEGDASLRRVDPYDLLPDPEATSFDRCRYVIEARYVSLYEVRARFPERGHLVKGDEKRPNTLDRKPKERGFESVPQSNPAAIDRTGAFPGTATSGQSNSYAAGQTREDYTGSVLLKEVWVRSDREVETIVGPGEHIKDTVACWEYCAVAGNVVLCEDTSNPFPHGQLPYQRLPLAEMGEFWSIPIIEHIAPAQIALNRLLAALQTNAELTGNPILLEPDNSGISRTKIINKPGGRLTANQGPIAFIRWLDPPSMPAEIIQLIGFWRDSIDRISGISAVARGSNLRRREPAAAVDTIQEASFVRIRAVLRNLEEALRRSGSQVVSNIANFYTEPRAVPLVGPRGAESYLQLAGRHFWYPYPVGTLDKLRFDDRPLDFDVWVNSGSGLPLSRQARAAEADALFFQGILDPASVLEAHDWPTIDRTMAARAEGIASGAVEPGGVNPRRRPGGQG